MKVILRLTASIGSEKESITRAFGSEVFYSL